MLVIWRKAGESIVLGDSIDVEVLEMRAHRVKLGIVAPQAISISRKETKLTRDENVTAALSMDCGLIENLLSRLSGYRRHN
ncbi:MAG TPA: carbon storage regulator [Bryobacteraceae bacterium]|jgi:carbon storage regulator|nr:carbon storage regulator [Bryobacteraceae bacterium]